VEPLSKGGYARSSVKADEGKSVEGKVVIHRGGGTIGSTARCAGKKFGNSTGKKARHVFFTKPRREVVGSRNVIK